jgi:hypothetical protein
MYSSFFFAKSVRLVSFLSWEHFSVVLTSFINVKFILHLPRNRRSRIKITFRNCPFSKLHFKHKIIRWSRLLEFLFWIKREKFTLFIYLNFRLLRFSLVELITRTSLNIFNKKNKYLFKKLSVWIIYFVYFQRSVRQCCCTSMYVEWAHSFAVKNCQHDFSSLLSWIFLVGLPLNALMRWFVLDFRFVWVL